MSPRRSLIAPACLTALLTSLALPATALAQGKFVLTPFVGNYYTLTTMATDAFQDGSNFELRQLSAVAFGGRLAVWLSPTLGVEASATFNKSKPQLQSGDSVSFTFKGNILLASGRLLYRPARTNLNLIIGGGIAKRGGEAWEGGEKLTAPAIVAGLGVRAAVTPNFALTVNVEGNFYSFDFDGSGPNGKKMQADLVVSIGVPITLGR
jgi:hypothetical protein